MKKSRRKEDGGIDFWQPTSDMLTALIFMLLLIMLLLMLYLMRVPDEQEEASYEMYEQEDDDDDGRFAYEGLDDEEGDGDGEDDDDGGGGGGDDGDGDGEGDDEGDYPVPDDTMKAAVYVKVVDAETGQLIPQEGVNFELYRTNGALQILNTYYPVKISYREYETTERGIFYLPEKITEGDYYFRNLTAVEGYDMADDAYFEIYEPYDWPDPYVVTIPVSPCRNIIRVQMKDAASGVTITGGTFDVIAAEDIITGDGTVRYQRGEVVGQIVCDENGYGESEELYLGHYTVRQRDIPAYYAGQEEALLTAVEQKTDVEAPLRELLSDKTSITLRLTDELYTTRPLAGVTFQMTCDSQPGRTTLTTDSSGTIYVEDLEKNTEYRFTQVDAPENYTILEESYTVAVDAEGRMDGQSQTVIEAANRCLRVSVGVEDTLLGRQISGRSLALYDEDGRLLDEWTTGRTENVLEGLEEGSYYLVLDEDDARRYDFDVADESGVQSCSVRIWAVLDYMLLAACAAGAAGLVALAVFIVRRPRKKKQEAEEQDKP